MEWVLLVIIGAAAGTLGALVGLGGGIIIVPALLYFGTATDWLHDLAPRTAVGISTVIMIFTGLASTLSYLKRKIVDYKAGLIFFIGSGPGGILGAHVNKILDVESFYIYFGIFMILMAVVLLVKNRLRPMVFKEGKGKVLNTYIDEKKNQSIVYGYHPAAAVLISFIVGFTSGIFGIGGGSLIVPAMILLFFFPPHVAVATSMFLVFLTSVTNSITHVALGNVYWPYALVLIPSAWAGAKLGAYINSKIAGKSLETILKAAMVLIGLRLIYQGLTG
ncbi:sulfite exporter TauE/SafE family protein [Bacillus massiliglaciei]|uniref:sulfite exporter TauE/SafE family protein n=1 Tax=Bacillus massiliglaciei TaxID=1816693 RepID=UPI000B215A65|nr:sulfite exporter TauE/SafE family protein [Bacillus massiliglaciei]